MITVFHPTGIVKGNVSLPSSKSISNRVLIIRAISGKNFSIDDLSQSTDTLTLFKLLFGKEDEYDCGDGGTTFRFLLALKVLKEEACILTGSERMQQRPVKPLVDALIQLGADIQYLKNEGFPPLKINQSPLNGNAVTIDATISSQFISALMMIAPLLPQGLTINLEGTIVSSSYILLTKKIMEYFGVVAEINKNKITIPPAKYKNRNIIVEKDWSAASYWFEIVALAKEADIFIEGLHIKSMQGDVMIVDLAKRFGVITVEENDGLRLTKSGNFKLPQNFEFDFIDHPDLVQTLSMICAACGVNGKFKGILTLKIKETDRIEALRIVLDNAGIILSELPDSFIMDCSKPVITTSEIFPVFNDHRMAMALAPLSLVSGKMILSDGDVVKKSYPAYWNELSKIGFVIQ